MKNYVHRGDTVELTAPYAVSSGGGCKVGSIFAVAINDVANGAKGQFHRTGCFDLPKTTGEAWTVGAKLYWNDTTKAVTTTVSTNLLIGVAEEAAASGDTVGRILLGNFA
ncbi:DUF2190 family protein [Permianibacter sp. IMCC34836]|uniref:DUF2190 family protein n=1 Tax=Permianibacter fluminis TaxID=2738515 RepID=UPI001556C094|nr:DUF2190 family protein [Permianibacter fluminis]NQD37472.1 DUF2190 family protein [Permianibacter fluminis]